MRRLRDEPGFTLIELLVVVVILGVLVAIAIPAYLGLKGQSQTAAAKSNVRSAIPAAEDMNAANGDYAGITGAALRSSAPGVGASVNAVAVHANAGYCIEDSEDGGSTFFDYVGGNPGSALQAGFSRATVQPGTCLRAVGIAAS
ncbi:MAG TPA: prepilin-type N-terminal cleavage/methylation domain-containing protein [Gaiellaceae bacterium]|jgi:prepilin-type N-terminal cleavage/methylation domain-containing protein